MVTLQVIARVKASCKGREVPEPIPGHHPRVLDAHAAEAHEIETRLDCYDVTFQQAVLARPAKRRLLVHVEPDAVTGGVVHLRSSGGALESPRRRPVATVDEDLTNALVDVSAGRSGCDRLDPGVQRLQGRGMHAPDLVWNLAHHNRSGEVAVIVTGPARGKDVDDDRRIRAYRALASVVRHRALRRAG